MLEDGRHGRRHRCGGLHFDLVLAGLDQVGGLGAQVLWLIAGFFWEEIEKEIRN